MEQKNSIQKYSITGGFFVSSIFPLLIFSKSSFIDICTPISDFGQFWNPIFWGILFPIFIILFFGYSAKKINPSLNEIPYFQACFQFSFAISLKIIITLFILYLIEQFGNGISVVFKSQIYDRIVFSILTILFLSFILMVLTFISSLIIVKLSRNPQTLNETK